MKFVFKFSLRLFSLFVDVADKVFINSVGGNTKQAVVLSVMAECSKKSLLAFSYEWTSIALEILSRKGLLKLGSRVRNQRCLLKLFEK